MRSSATRRVDQAVIAVPDFIIAGMPIPFERGTRGIRLVASSYVNTLSIEHRAERVEVAALGGPSMFLLGAVETVLTASVAYLQWVEAPDSLAVLEGLRLAL